MNTSAAAAYSPALSPATTQLPTQTLTPLPTQTSTLLPTQRPSLAPTQRSRSLVPTATRTRPNVAQAEAIGAVIEISPVDVSSERNEMVAQRTAEPASVEPTATESPTPLESPTPFESPTPAIMSLESRSQDNVVPIALGGFGVVTVLYVLAIAQYLASRSKNFSNCPGG